MSEPTGDTLTLRNHQWMRKLGAGEVLFKEGDMDRRVYVLLDGRVEVIKDGERIAEFGVSESFIGEISALTGKPRWATVRTVAPSTMLVVNDIEELFRVGPEWGLRLSRILAERLDRTNQRLARVQSLLEETREREGDTDFVETLKLAAHSDDQSV